MAENEGKLVEALRASLRETAKLRQQNRALTARARRADRDRGDGCRYPGGVDGPEELWRLLVRRRGRVGGFPADRGWDVGGLVRSGAGQAGPYLRAGGGFLYGAAEFDPAFFGISPREAADDGSAAAAVAGGVLGGVGAGRDRSDLAAGQQRRGVRGGDVPRLRAVGRRGGRHDLRAGWPTRWVWRGRRCRWTRRARRRWWRCIWRRRRCGRVSAIWRWRVG